MISGELSIEQCQKTLEHRDPFRKGQREHPLTFGDMVEIIGKEKAPTPNQRINIWEVSIKGGSNKHLCSESFLLKAAEENKNGEDWRIVYIP